jgi:hypothetical protein
LRPLQAEKAGIKEKALQKQELMSIITFSVFQLRESIMPFKAIYSRRIYYNG